MQDQEATAPAPSSGLAEAVYRELRRNLIAGRFRPGTALRLRGLATALGTSVQPVRDALQRLVADGALEFAPNRSIRVPAMSKASLVELYRVRFLLEGEAGAMAAETGRTDLAAAARSIAEMEAASERGDTAAYSAANVDFHFGIYRAAQSHHLVPLIETLWLKIGPMLDIGSDGETRAHMRLFEGQDCHRAIVGALGRRDAEAARAEIVADLERGRDWFLAHYDFPQAAGAPGIRRLESAAG